MSFKTYNPKLIVLPFLAATLVASIYGCAKGKNQQGAIISQGPSSVVQPKNTDKASNFISYRMSHTDNTARDAKPPIQVSIPLVKTDAGYKTSAPLVVPAEIPNRLVVEAVFSDLILSDFLIEGALFKEGKTIRSLPSTMFNVRGSSSNQLRFAITDVRSLLSDEIHESISILLRFIARDEQENKFEISFDVQSPPSLLTQTFYFPVSRYENERQSKLSDDTRRIRLPTEEALDLVGVVEHKNQDDQAVFLGIPLELIHESSLLNRVKSVSSSECSSQTHEITSRMPIGSRLRMLPIQSIVASAGDVSFITVAGNSSALVGIYSERDDYFKLPPSTLSNQNVPIRCMARCNRGAEGDWADLGKWGGDCLACGRASGNTGESCYRCMNAHREWCRWQDWASWKDYSTLQTGSSFEIEIRPELNGNFSKLALSYKDQPLEIPPRIVKTLSGNITIKE